MEEDRAAEAEQQRLFADAYPRLVAVVSSVAGSRHEAEEAVQEAFVRLLGRWDRVSGYDDTEAWLRRVAVRVALNRSRKTRNGLRALARSGPPRAADGPTGDGVDVARALRSLPVDQRLVLVLKYFVGLDVEAIAAETGVPTGTVKSRLSRGRAALAPLLRVDWTEHV